MSVKSIVRWVIVTCILTLLIIFPRGVAPELGSNYVPHAPVQWFSWDEFWSGVSAFFQPYTHFSLGTTFAGDSVFQEVESHFRDSLGLLILSLCFVVVLGVAKGMYDGFRDLKTTVFSRISAAVQGIVESLPDFFVINCLILLSFFLLRKGYHVYFMGSQEFFTGTLVPAIIMAAVPTMYMGRMVRMNIEEQFGQQYLVTAEAKGIKRWRIILRHVLPNCFPTVLGTLVPTLAMLFSNLVIVEYLFYKKGIVAGLIAAMGINGTKPIYEPVSLDLSEVRYYGFDAHLVFAYIFVCILFILLCWLVIRVCLHIIGYRGFSNPYTGTFREQTSTRRWSWHLTVGLGLVAFLLIVGLLRHVLPIPDPHHQDYIHFNPDGSMSSPPYLPFSPGHLLGSDRDGRDLFGEAIYGILPTFGYVTLTVAMILCVSTLLAVLSSVWKVPGIRFIIQVWNSLFSVIPGVIAAFVILNIPDVYWFGLYVNLDGGFWSFAHIMVFIGVLCVVEIGRVASHLQFVLDESCGKSYMEAAEIAGNTPWTALWIHHVVPLRNALLEQFVVGFSRILLLLATLGFLYQPMNQEWLSQGDFLTYVITSTDWGSLIASNARDFYANNWMLFPFVLLITCAIVSMNLLRTGILRFTQTVPVVHRKEQTSLQRVDFLLPSRKISQDS